MSHLDLERPESRPGLVPLTRLRAGAPAEAWDEERLRVLEGHLAAFESQLSEGERTAFGALFGARTTALTALGAVPPEEILDAEERELVARLAAEPRPIRTGLPRSLALVMKGTRLCNLRCTYCSSWSDDRNQVMTFPVLARATRDALAGPGIRDVQFVWHGGETTLRPLSFYRKALWLQERFRRPGQRVTNSVQTNGTHLTPEWLDFLKRYRVSTAVSLDGPPEIHDRRRVDTRGRPTSERARAGLRKLQEHGISHNILMVVDQDVVQLGAERLLEYLLSIDVRVVGLLNVAPEGDPSRPSEDEPYMDFGEYVEFLRALFRLWYPRWVDRISFHELSGLLSKVGGGPGSSCTHNGNCVGTVFTVEPQGDVYHCDKYQNCPEFRFGNVLEGSLLDAFSAPPLLHARGYTQFGIDLARGCRWSHVCRGGCPYDRYVRVVRKGGVQDERCCGLAPLLSDMEEALGAAAPGRREAEAAIG
ncbi:MAG TPA: radical SAM protein [Longimicrobiaceae bacterium]|jgi:uncharacterized protein